MIQMVSKAVSEDKPLFNKNDLNNNNWQDAEWSWKCKNGLFCFCMNGHYLVRFLFRIFGFKLNT